MRIYKEDINNRVVYNQMTSKDLKENCIGMIA